MGWHLATFPYEFWKKRVRAAETGWEFTIDCEKFRYGRYWRIGDTTVDITLYILIDPRKIQLVNSLKPYEEPVTKKGMYGHEQLHVLQIQAQIGDSIVPGLDRIELAAREAGRLDHFEFEEECDIAIQQFKGRIRTFLRGQEDRLGGHYSEEDRSAPAVGSQHAPYGDKPFPDNPAPFPEGHRHPFPPLQ